MDEKPKSIWKKSWTGWRGFLLSSVLAFAVVAAIGWLAGADAGLTLSIAGILIVVSLVMVFGVCLFRWFFCWRNLKRSLFGLACLATLIALFYAEEDWRGWHAWNKFKHEWEAQGEKFDFTSVVPPPVPDDQNFAMAPIWVESMKAALGPKNSRQWFGDNFAENGRTNFVNRIFNMPLTDNDSYWRTNGQGNWEKATLTDLKPWQNYYRALAAKTNSFPAAPQPQSPAQDVLLALSKYDSTIEEMRQAGQRPFSRFPLNYNRDEVWAILLPHLAALKRCTQVLQLRAIAELQNGQSDKALDDVKLELRLADAIRTEPFLISHLFRIAILQIALQPVYEGLAEHRWSDAQLVALDAELAKLEFLADYKLSMRGEMGCQNGIFDLLIRNHRELFNISSVTGSSSGPPFISSLIPTGWFYQNRLRCARMMVEFYIPLADVDQQTVSPAAVRHADEVLKAGTKKITPYNILERMLFPALGNAVEKFARAQSSVDSARVAVALERYRLAHGEFPGSLDTLAPQFLEKVPHDIIGGQPLHYRRTSDGQFVLYSVGWNERDDGGVVVLTKGSTPSVDINQGDWVWRYPAR